MILPIAQVLPRGRKVFRLHFLPGGQLGGARKAGGAYRLLEREASDDRVCHCFAEAVACAIPDENTASAKQWHTHRRLSVEPLLQRMARGGTSDLGDGPGQGDFLGANFRTVLGVAADLDPALGRYGVESLGRRHLADRVRVEQLDLGNGVGAHEGPVVGLL